MPTRAHSSPDAGETPRRGRRPRRPPADLVERLAAGAAFCDIASAYGVDRGTVAKWAGLPEVVAGVEELRGRTLADARRRLSGALDPAVSAVFDVFGDVAGRCEHCGRSGANPRDKLSAAELVFDRLGLPATKVTEVSGTVGLPVPTATDAESERTIVDEAASILEERGHHKLAEDVRAALRAA